MVLAQLILAAVVFGLLIVEALRASANERAQLARGGQEPAGDVYTVMRFVYPGAFTTYPGPILLPVGSYVICHRAVDVAGNVEPTKCTPGAINVDDTAPTASLQVIPSTPNGLAGWYVTEIGRQPFIVYGLIRTADVVAAVPPAMIGATLVLYVVLYLALIVAYVSVLKYMAEKPEAVLHIVLSHHGKLEHGSPVVPCTREATLVHFVDNLGGNLGSFDRIERSLADGASWSDFDRGISASAFFATREQARREEAA